MVPPDLCPHRPMPAENMTTSLTLQRPKLILLKNPSGQKVTVKKTISDISPGNSNRVRTKLARKNSRHFSCIFTHLQKRGVLQQNQLRLFLAVPLVISPVAPGPRWRLSSRACSCASSDLPPLSYPDASARQSLLSRASKRGRPLGRVSPIRAVR